MEPYKFAVGSPLSVKKPPWQLTRWPEAAAAASAAISVKVAAFSRESFSASALGEADKLPVSHQS